MPWPRPHRALCFLCVASCESGASSFGVNSVLAASAARAVPSANPAVNLARGGGAGAGSHSSSSLGTASGGVHDSGPGGVGTGGGRQGVSVVQAVAEVQQVAVREDLAGAAAAGIAEEEQRESSSPQQPPPSSPPPSLEDGELLVWAPTGERRLYRCCLR